MERNKCDIWNGSWPIELFHSPSHLRIFTALRVKKWLQLWLSHAFLRNLSNRSGHFEGNLFDWSTKLVSKWEIPKTEEVQSKDWCKWDAKTSIVVFKSLRYKIHSPAYVHQLYPHLLLYSLRSATLSVSAKLKYMNIYTYACSAVDSAINSKK